MSLTLKQLDVLELMFIGKTNDEIAQIRGIGEKSAQNAVLGVIKDLGAYNRCNAVYIALRQGLLKVPAAPEAETAAPEPIVRGDLVLDRSARRAIVKGKPVRLHIIEYRLLEFFLQHCGRVFDRGTLLDRVWGNGVDIELRAVDVHVSRLRKALAPCGDIITTEYGAGYCCEKVAA